VPSPKDQLHDVGDPVDASVNATPLGSQRVVGPGGRIWARIGDAVVTDCMAVAVAPLAPVTVRFTEYVPGVEYTWVGFCNDDTAPSPKDQLHDTGLPQTPVTVEILKLESVNDTVLYDVFEVKFA